MSFFVYATPTSASRAHPRPIQTPEPTIGPAAAAPDGVAADPASARVALALALPLALALAPAAPFDLEADVLATEVAEAEDEGGLSNAAEMEITDDGLTIVGTTDPTGDVAAAEGAS